MGSDDDKEARDEPLRDLLLALVHSNEDKIGSALESVLKGSKHAALVLDVTKEEIPRKELVRKTKIDATNITKVTGPLVRAGWLHQRTEGAEVRYHRSDVIGVLLGDRTLPQWRKERQANE